jgi:hypothetical protein
MIIVLNKDEFDFEKIEIRDIIPNSIIEGGYFNRIIYNDVLFSMNGIFIKLNFKILKIESYFNKFKLYFLKDKNIDIINYVLGLESDILSHQRFNDLTPVYRIKEQINNNLLKALYLNNSKITNTDVQKLDLSNMDIILKISGIWSNDNKYGLTFRFFLPTC